MSITKHKITILEFNALNFLVIIFYHVINVLSFCSVLINYIAIIFVSNTHATQYNFVFVLWKFLSYNISIFA